MRHIKLVASFNAHKLPRCMVVVYCIVVPVVVIARDVRALLARTYTGGA